MAFCYGWHAYTIMPWISFVYCLSPHDSTTTTRIVKAVGGCEAVTSPPPLRPGYHCHKISDPSSALSLIDCCDNVHVNDGGSRPFPCRVPQLPMRSDFLGRLAVPTGAVSDRYLLPQPTHHVHRYWSLPRPAGRLRQQPLLWRDYGLDCYCH